MGSIYKFYVPDDQKNVICERGETNLVKINIKDSTSKTLVDPSTVSISIYNPCSTKIVNEVAMTKDDTGKYSYYYDITADAAFGEYEVEIVTSSPTYKNIYRDRYILLPWNAIQEVRRKAGITSKKSIDEKDISLIILEAYEEILNKVYKLRKNETFLCNPDTGDWINGTNKIFAVKNPPIADSNGDGQVSGKGELICGEDITLLWKDVDGDCHEGKVTVLESECGKIQLTQSDDSALPSDLCWAKVTYGSEWHAFDLALLKKAVVYLAAYECLIRFTSLIGTTQADLNPNVIKFNVRRKSLEAKYKSILRLIKKPVVGSGMLPGK
jgi:hypothetical protein